PPATSRAPARLPRELERYPRESRAQPRRTDPHQAAQEAPLPLATVPPASQTPALPWLLPTLPPQRCPVAIQKRRPCESFKKAPFLAAGPLLAEWPFLAEGPWQLARPDRA